MLSKAASSTILEVFGMTWPGIEPLFLGRLANSLTIMPMTRCIITSFNSLTSSLIFFVYILPCQILCLHKLVFSKIQLMRCKHGLKLHFHSCVSSMPTRVFHSCPKQVKGRQLFSLHMTLWIIDITYFRSSSWAKGNMKSVGPFV